MLARYELASTPPGEGMATLADLGSLILIQEHDRWVTVSVVRGMAIHTSRCIGVHRLPLSKKGMEMAVKVPGVRRILMALEAVIVGDRLGERSRLVICVRYVGIQVACSQTHGVNAS